MSIALQRLRQEIHRYQVLYVNHTGLPKFWPIDRIVRVQQLRLIWHILKHLKKAEHFLSKDEGLESIS